MTLEWLVDPAAWAGLATLVLLEIVLGIDNLIFIAILADKLPEQQRNRARLVGLSLALLMRLVLLASISWLVTLTEPLFEVFGSDISWRDLILILGGLFLLFKGTLELHERLEGGPVAATGSPIHAVYWQVIAQIVVLDAVFSLDSVITAVGMVGELSIMVIAVIVAMGVMMLASRPLMAFVSRHPTVVVLCLGFLLMIGFSLIVEGLGFHIPKGYLYAAIGFSILIEAANQLGRRNLARRVTMSDARDRTAQAVLRILRGGKNTSVTSEEVAAIVSSGGPEPAFTADESSMIERVLRLSDRPVRSIMIPRVDTVWLDIDDAPEQLLQQLYDSGHSRFPVCRDQDTVLGIVHAKDLLRQQEPGDHWDLRSALRAPLFVTEAMPVLKLLEEFKKSPVHLAIVVDEHDAFKGIVTPADILAAIAGHLPEILGAQDLARAATEPGVWMLHGRARIDQVETRLAVTGMQVDPDFATLGGFLLHQLGHLPGPGEGYDWNGWRFEVLDLDGQRVGNVRAIRL